MLILANLFWGLSFPVIKAIAMTHARLLPESSTWFIASWSVGPRFILATVVLLALFGRSLGSATRREWVQGLGLGLFAAIGMLLQTDGLQFTAASTSAFLTQLYAILIPLYLALRLRRLPPWTVGVSSVMVLAGVAILGRFDWAALRFGRGEAETLIASLFFMGQILWLEKKVFSGNRVMPVTIIMFAVEALVFLALSAGTAPHLDSLVATFRSVPWVGLTAMLTLFSTIGSYLIMNTFQPRITATEAGLIYCIEPIFGSLLALFLPALFSVWAGIDYPNETATANLLVGGGLITGANLLIQLKPLPKD